MCAFKKEEATKGHWQIFDKTMVKICDVILKYVDGLTQIECMCDSVSCLS